MIFMSGNSGKSTTLILILLGLGVLVLLLAAREGRDRPISIATTHAVGQNLISWITTNGKVEPVEPRIIQAQLTTFIEAVAVKEGQRVDRGQLLMTLDAKDLKTELAHMREQLVAAENERKIAVTGGSPEEIAQLYSDLVKTNAEIDRLRSERDSLRSEEHTSELQSPCNLVCRLLLEKKKKKGKASHLSQVCHATSTC